MKHQWSSTEDTRRAILDAARGVFGKNGYAEANVAEIVAVAGSSVGSLYHHFGGKSELFHALWDRFRDAQRELVATAVAAGPARGVDDPFEQFLAGAAAILDSSWESRDLVRIFYEGDTPPGFGKELADHRRSAVAGPLNALSRGDDAVHRVVVLAFTSVITEARREIARSRSATDARTLGANVLDILGRMRGLVA